MTRFDRWIISSYWGVFIIAISFGDPTGLISVPALFILKDQLHFGPGAVAIFETLILFPHFVAVLFGMLRDRWSPFGLGDRGYFILAAPVAAAAYGFLAIGQVSFYSLLGAVVLAMVAYQFIEAASQALVAGLGQRHAMTGRLSAFTELTESVALLAAAFIGGWMVTHSSFQTIFLSAGAVSLVVFAMGLVKPAAIFNLRTEERLVEVGLRPIWVQMRRIWPVAAIFLLYNFSPGWGTPLFYYLTDHLQLSPEIYGTCRALTFAGNAASTLIYGFLCFRYPLKRLLWWSILCNIAPGALFLLARGPSEAIIVSAALGLVVGFANVALFDLLMRSCPVSMEGSISMMGASMFGIASAIGDLSGAWLYDNAGFASCVVVDAAATLMILPLLLKLPQDVIASKEGETTAVATAQAAQKAKAAQRHVS